MVCHVFDASDYSSRRSLTALQPLPLDALREPSFEALFADQNFVEFNPIQTQVGLHA